MTIEPPAKGEVWDLGLDERRMEDCAAARSEATRRLWRRSNEVACGSWRSHEGSLAADRKKPDGRIGA